MPDTIDHHLPVQERQQRDRSVGAVQGDELLLAAALGEGDTGDLGAEARPDRDLEWPLSFRVRPVFSFTSRSISGL